MWQHRWALLSGFLGATASCLVKMAVTFDDPGSSSGEASSSPLLYLSNTYCQTTSWMVDFDSCLLQKIHYVLGTLMVKHRINFTRQFKSLQDMFLEKLASQGIFEIDYCQLAIVPARVLCLIGMLLFNAYMIACFLKGLKVSGSVVGTALSSAANFSLSALYGYTLWGERFNPIWWIGFTCVMMGVLVLSSVQAVDKSSDPPPPSQPPPPKLMSSWKAKQQKQQQDKRSNQNQYQSPARGNPTTITTYGKRESKIKRPSPPSKHIQNENARRSSTLVPKFEPCKTRDSTAELKAQIAEQYVNDPRMTKIIQPPPSLAIKKQSLKPALVDRTFANECMLCEGELFDETTGESPTAIADLSPNCYHILHSKCLKATPKEKGKKTKCPICDQTVSFWSSAKQAAHFAGFWIDRVECLLQEIGPITDENGVDQPRPVDEIRHLLAQDPTLSDNQKQYIDDDPTGLGKGLKAALEWGGYVDYNNCPKGNVKWSQCLRTKGLWEYNAKRDDIWLYEWNSIHPRQRCDNCQIMKRPLDMQCPGCIGSSEEAFYCSQSCQKRGWMHHKMTCSTWQQNGPPTSTGD